MTTSSLQNSVVSLSYFFKQGRDLVEVVSLFLFVFFHLLTASLLCLGSPDLVHNFVNVQSSLVVSVAEFWLVGLPLFICVLWRIIGVSALSPVRFKPVSLIFERVCGVLLLIFVGYHLYVSFSVVMNGLGGYQYFQDILFMQNSQLLSLSYWFFLLAAVYQALFSIRRLSINFGIASVVTLQTKFFRLGYSLFFCLVGWILYLAVRSL